jgi:hypothetical protein
MAIETWTAFESGKYKGKTLPEVALNDPPWFCTQLERHTIDFPRWERMEIWYKARNIAIPEPDPNNWSIGWVISADNKLVDFHIVKALDAPGDFAFITDHVDFWFVSSFAKGNSKAAKRLSVAFRRNYFGGAEATKQKCELFFSNNKNFVWRGIKPSFFEGRHDSPYYI